MGIKKGHPVWIAFLLNLAERVGLLGASLHLALRASFAVQIRSCEFVEPALI